MKGRDDLIEHLLSRGVLRTPNIIESFRAVDRADFVLPDSIDEAYGDYPLSIDYGQTISQPSTVAFMMELLQPKEGQRILDVGSGSGWTTALLAKIVGEKGCVVGVEKMPELANFGQNNLKKYHFKNAKIVLAGKAVGLAGEAPFDKILVSAAARELPTELIDQLEIGGTMVIPIVNSVLKIDRVTKENIKQKEFSGFAFVPLK